MCFQKITVSCKRGFFLFTSELQAKDRVKALRKGIEKRSLVPEEGSESAS